MIDTDTGRPLAMSRSSAMLTLWLIPASSARMSRAIG
jgi:hypothetical protein